MVCFFVLAYVLAWGAIPWNSFFAPGALIAALVVVLLTEGPRGLLQLGSRLIRWRVSWPWYALAIGVPLSAHVAAASINVGLGASAPSPDVLTSWYGLPLALALHIVSPLGGPLMEEPSFRGFAQPELQKNRSRLAATAIMAVLITGWHAPLFFMAVFEAHPIGFVTTLAVTFWYAWLFNRASGSSLITLIAHGVEGGVETTSMWEPGTDLVRLDIAYSAVWCLVALGLLVLDRRSWTAGAPAQPVAESILRARSPTVDPGGRMRTELVSSIDIAAPAPVVWKILVDFDAFSGWNPFITSAAGPLRVGGRLTLRMQPVGGSAVTLRPSVVEVVEGHRLRWQGRLVVRGLCDADHLFVVEALGADRCRLVQREQFGGLLVPLLRRSLDRGTLPAFHAMNDAVKARAERATAARVRPEP